MPHDRPEKNTKTPTFKFLFVASTPISDDEVPRRIHSPVNEIHSDLFNYQRARFLAMHSLASESSQESPPASPPKP